MEIIPSPILKCKLNSVLSDSLQKKKELVCVFGVG